MKPPGSVYKADLSTSPDTSAWSDVIACSFACVWCPICRSAVDRLNCRWPDRGLGTRNYFPTWAWATMSVFDWFPYTERCGFHSRRIWPRIPGTCFHARLLLQERLPPRWSFCLHCPCLLRDGRGGSDLCRFCSTWNKTQSTCQCDLVCELWTANRQIHCSWDTWSTLYYTQKSNPYYREETVQTLRRWLCKVLFQNCWTRPVPFVPVFHSLQTIIIINLPQIYYYQISHAQYTIDKIKL